MDIQQETMPKTEIELYCRRPLLSLQEMSRLRITTTLCNNQQLIGLIMKCKFQEQYDCRLYTRRGPEWAAVQEMANELLSQICNCVKIRERIMECVWPVSYRLMLWKSVYAPSIGNQFLQHFYWTDQGRIDYIRTAKHIIANKNIPAKERFVLACSVCLSNDIEEIWQEMSIDDQIYFVDGDNNERIRPLLLFWADTMAKSELVELDDVSREVFDDACACAFDKGLINALKYFLTISAENERTEMASKYFCRFFNKMRNTGGFLETDHLDMCYFLFFEMNNENRYTYSFLMSTKLTLLLHFSEREHFLNALNIAFQSVGQVIEMLNIMFFNYHLEIVKDDDFFKVFVHIWRSISDSMRRDIADGNVGGKYISLLVRDNFPFLLRKDSLKKMSELTSLDWNHRTSEALFGFHRGKWEFLQFLVQEGMVTIPTLKIFRRDVKDDLKIRHCNKAAWNRFLRVMHKVGCRN